MAEVATIREALPVIGRMVVEITCDDHDEIAEKFPNPADRISRIYLHFDDGSTASFVVGEGDLAFCFDGYPEGHPFTEDEG